jgi:transcriptional regulator of arginine metabolism
MAEARPATKASRHQLITELVASQPIHSQTELAELLADRGVQVTQATLSRDLVFLDAVKVRLGGGYAYAIPAEGGDRRPAAPSETASARTRLARLCAELLVTADASANLVVLRTPPGAAQFLAGAVDKCDFSEILGTIAGDDTVLVIGRDPQGGDDLVKRFVALAEQTETEPERSV